jgi:shikimate dehydrogenase
MLPLLEQRPALLFIANRTVEKALALAAQFERRGLVGGGYADVGTLPFDLVVNATSASLRPME